MPRLTPITKREQVSGDGLVAFDAIIESRGSINAPQSLHMYVPSSRAGYTHLCNHPRETPNRAATSMMVCLIFP